VQASVDFYGTQFLSKSLTFAWCWLGTRQYWGYDRESQHNMMDEVVGHCDSGKIKSHLTTRLKLTRDGLKRAHELIEANATVGKVGLGVDEEGEGEAFE
jgi:NADPH:quinone reductase-like Zn-dependent oxidoreductase